MSALPKLPDSEPLGYSAEQMHNYGRDCADETLRIVIKLCEKEHIPRRDLCLLFEALIGVLK